MSWSSSQLNSVLSREKSISEILKSTSSLFEGYQEKINENRDMKQKNIQLASSLKAKTDQDKLRDAEIAVIRKEYQDKIDKLKNTEAQLRSTIQTLTIDKNDSVRNLQNSLNAALDATENQQNIAFIALQKRIEDLQAENAALLQENENIVSQNKKLLEMNKKTPQNSTNSVEKHEQRLSTIRENYQKDAVQITQLQEQIQDEKMNYVHELGSLENRYVSEQRETINLKNQLEIANNQIIALVKQNKQIKANNKKIVEKIIETKDKTHFLSIELDTLKNHISSLEHEILQKKHENHQIKKRIKHYNSIGYCSPLQLQRLNIMKKLFNDRERIYHQISGTIDISIRSLVICAIFANRWKTLSKASATDYTATGGLNKIASERPILLPERLHFIQKHLKNLRAYNEEDNQQKSSLNNEIDELESMRHEQEVQYESKALQLKMARHCHNMLHTHMSLSYSNY